MCFKAKVNTPKVKTADIVAPPAPLKESPEGVQFGGSDDDDSQGTGSSEVSGVSGLKVKPDSSIKNEQSDSSSTATKQVSSTAKKAVRKSVFNSSSR